MLFGDGDHAPGFNLAASTFGTSGPSNFDMFSDDRNNRKGSSHCASDGSSASVIHCETAEDLGSFVTTNSSDGEGADQPGHQGSNAGPNAPAGAGFRSSQQLLAFEMIAAQNMAQNMAWQWDVIQGTFPPCSACDGIPPVVGAPALISDFASPIGNSDPTSDPPPIVDPPDIDGGTQQQLAVPEMPSWAMLLIGFGGLALLGGRRLRQSAGLGNRSGDPIGDYGA